MSGAASFVSDVAEGVVDVVKDVGSFIDDKVIQPIVQDPVEAVATAVGYYLGGPPGAAAARGTTKLAQGEEPEDALKSAALTYVASTGAEYLGAPSGSAGNVSDSVYQGASGTAPATVPSAFDTAVNSTLDGGSTLGQFGSTGTAGFGTALPPASNVTEGLISSGFSPGTAANLAGETAAGIGATNLLGGATAAAPLIPSASLSLTDALRGARLVSGLLTPQQQAMPQQMPTSAPQGNIDYSQLLGLLSQRANATGLLGTRFQPQPINLASLLG